MTAAKRKRRVRGADGQLRPKEESNTIQVTADAEGSSEKEITQIETKGSISRSEKDSIQEKITKDEKDNSPIIIISYKDNTGKRVSKQFTCEKIEWTENRHRKLQKSGPQTKLDLYIEASVIEEM